MKSSSTVALQVRIRQFLCSLDPSVIVRYIFNMLFAAVTCIKHEGFKEEREWRAIYAPKLLENPYSDSLMKSSIEVIQGVPQTIYKLPLDANEYSSLADLDLSRIFDRLIIGASPYKDTIKEAFFHALTDIGVTDAEQKVVISGIPVRS